MPRIRSSPIGAPLTLKTVARRLGLNPHYCKGAVESFGITLHPVGRSLLMSETDFKRFKKHMEKQPRVERASIG